MNVLFVCLGNICRSPLAEVVFADLVKREGWTERILVDSAGTAGYHGGESADRRSMGCARRHGLEITHIARGLIAKDYERFDLMVAMDESNATDLRLRAPNPAAARKVHLLREWDPAGPGDVPDPYYGGDADFEHVWHLCERSAPGLFRFITSRIKREGAS